MIDTIAVTPQIRRVNDPAKPEPRLTPAAARARAEREARQAEALRANLRRRKVQARGRDSQQEDGPRNPPHGVYPDSSE